jgi:ParB family chromosome partitioning protein
MGKPKTKARKTNAVRPKPARKGAVIDLKAKVSDGKAVIVGGEAVTVAPDGGGILLLPLNKLSAAPFNPRKDMDDEPLRDLAESIAEHGVLENLIVRQLPGYGGKFQVYAGGRRYKAMQWLAKKGRWNASAPIIPCKLKPASEAEALEVAIVENVQREGLSALEEAEAFVELRRLDRKKYDTKTIADRIGRSVRYVQQRLNLVEKLVPAVRDKLKTGAITVDQARVLTIAPRAEQAKLATAAAKGEYGARDADQLRETIRRDLIPIGNAIFDHVTAGVPVVVDPDTNKKYFSDRKAYKAAQLKQARANVKKLAKGVGVLLIGQGYQQLFRGDWRPAKKGEKAKTVYFVADNGDVTKLEGVVKVKHDRGELSARDQAWQAKQAEQRARKADIAFVNAMQAKIAGDPAMAKRLLIYSVIVEGGALFDNLYVGGEAAPLTKKLLKAAGVAPFQRVSHANGMTQEQFTAARHAAEAKVAAGVFALEADKLDELVAAVVADLMTMGYGLDGQEPFLLLAAPGYGVKHREIATDAPAADAPAAAAAE